MARSFFPDFPGSAPGRVWPVAVPASKTATVPRVAWLATLLIAGLACVLAAIFAGLWWRGELHTEAVSLTLERMSAEAARLTDDQTRQRRVLVTTKIENSGRLTTLTEVTAGLRKALEEAQTQAAATESARQSLAAELEKQAAGERQKASFLQQERSRSAALEQTFSLTQNDLQQRAAEHDQHVDSLQTHLVSLREIVTVRDIEVRNITSAATEQIDRTRVAAQEIAREAEWLAAQLRTVTCERDRLHQEVTRLDQAVQSERAANQSLAHRIHQLECRIHELEARPNPAPGTGAGQPHPGPGHGPPHGKPNT